MAVDIATMRITTVRAYIPDPALPDHLAMCATYEVVGSDASTRVFEVCTPSDGTIFTHSTYNTWWEDNVNPVLADLGYNAPLAPPFNPYP